MGYYDLYATQIIRVDNCITLLSSEIAAMNIFGITGILNRSLPSKISLKASRFTPKIRQERINNKREMIGH
ncbi:MAG TPA: hypothetical protein DIT07_14910 [Sphingobacteriaceae bacterium]|nr:hypothetical protein [Sphingobacteriaceae bacterium]